LLEELADSLSPEHFYSEPNALVFRAAQALHSLGRPADMVSVASWLKAGGYLAAVGGQEYLLRVTNAQPAVANAEHHARAVRDLARARNVITACQTIAAEGYGISGEHAGQFVDSAEARMFAVAQDDQPEDSSDIHVAMGSCLREVGQLMRGEAVATIPWRMKQLQDRTGGMLIGKVYAIGGRPGSGKTSWALQEAVALAERADVVERGVGIFSIEMQEREATWRLKDEHEVTQRLLAQATGIPERQIRAGEISTDEHKRLLAAGEAIGRLPLKISSRPGITVTAIRAQVRRWIRQFDRRYGGKIRMGLVVVDYLQLIGKSDLDPKRAHNDTTALDDILKALVTMAKEFGVTVLCVSQLKRASEERKTDVYRLDDFRGSGTIEQHIYGGFMVHHDPDNDGNDRLHIVKMRGGECDQCFVVFDGPSCCYWEAAGYGYGAATGGRPGVY